MHAAWHSTQSALATKSKAWFAPACCMVGLSVLLCADPINTTLPKVGKLVRVQLDSMDPKYMPFRRKRAAVTDIELNAMKAWKDSLVAK